MEEQEQLCAYYGKDKGLWAWCFRVRDAGLRVLGCGGSGVEPLKISV